MDGSRIKSIFTRDKKKEELKPLEKAKAEEIVESLTKKVEDNYSLEDVDKAEKVGLTGYKIGEATAEEIVKEFFNKGN